MTVQLHGRKFVRAQLPTVVAVISNMLVRDRVERLTLVEQRDKARDEAELFAAELARVRGELTELKASILGRIAAEVQLPALYRERLIERAQLAERGSLPLH
jgi:hypothetical protein